MLKKKNDRDLLIWNHPIGQHKCSLVDAWDTLHAKFWSRDGVITFLRDVIRCVLSGCVNWWGGRDWGWLGQEKLVFPLFQKAMTGWRRERVLRRRPFVLCFVLSLRNWPTGKKWNGERKETYCRRFGYAIFYLFLICTWFIWLSVMAQCFLWMH